MFIYIVTVEKKRSIWSKKTFLKIMIQRGKIEDVY